MKNKRKLKIFLIVLLVIAVLIGGLAIWQRNNIASVIYYMKYSGDDLDRMNKENKEKLASALSEIDTNMPRELTEEEIAALKDGTITEEDAVEISLGITTLEEKLQQKSRGETNDGSTSQSSQNTSVSDTAKNSQSGISNLIAQLYVLKSSYISKLDGLEAEAKSEYAKTPAEQRTSTWKGSMVSKYSARVSAWESECDTKVEGIISQIKEELSKTGGDMSVIDTIRSTYENEKQIKKAQYLNTYLK